MSHGISKMLASLWLKESMKCWETTAVKMLGIFIKTSVLSKYLYSIRIYADNVSKTLWQHLPCWRVCIFYSYVGMRSWIGPHADIRVKNVAVSMNLGCVALIVRSRSQSNSLWTIVCPVTTEGATLLAIRWQWRAELQWTHRTEELRTDDEAWPNVQCQGHRGSGKSYCLHGVDSLNRLYIFISSYSPARCRIWCCLHHKSINPYKQ